MDMQKIGAFLAELRKEKKLTQDELGEQLGVTNKTVSRWENGNYLPPVEILQMLSKLYDVSINELLSGQRLNETSYKQNAEENIALALLQKSKDAKKSVALACVVCAITFVGGISLIMTGALLATSVWLRIVFITLAVALIASGVGVCCVLTVDAGVYECPVCGEKFVPSMKDFVAGAHTFTKRRLKCPNCGKKSFCKKRFK
ncbi:MAG: helix-turn-helix domain-containing protein [Candidatus Fimimonas sp.]